MPDLTRQTLGCRRRHFVAVVLASAAGITATAVVALVAVPRDATPAVTVVTVPAPMVIAVAVPVAESEPEAVAEPESEPVAEPRATSPRIDASCVLPRTDTAADPVCAWDDGLPAISADGRLIASAYYPDDGGRGNPGLSIRFTDTRTSRLVRDVVVLSPEEVDMSDVAPSPRLQARIARRAAAAQRRLDAGHYRSMVQLILADSYGVDGDDGDEPTVVGGLRTEVVGDGLRISDVASAEVVVQARFPISEAFPPRPADPDFDGCYPTRVSELSAWWDEASRHVYAEVFYSSPPCYCGLDLRAYVRRAPR